MKYIKFVLSIGCVCGMVGLFAASPLCFLSTGFCFACYGLTLKKD